VCDYALLKLLCVQAAVSCFISKCDFFDEGKVKIHYYVFHILDSHISGSVQGDLNTCMFNLLSDKFSGCTTFSTIYPITKISFT